MTYFITLVSSDKNYPLSIQHIEDVKNAAKAHNIGISEDFSWLLQEKAVDIPALEKPDRNLIVTLRDLLTKNAIDIFVTAAEARKKKLLLADMDSTIVSSETLDELAEFAGIKDKIAAITALAMEGKLDFKEALRERVELLQGLPADTLEKALATTRLNPGAETLVQTMKKSGALCVLISGGFTFFTGAIAEQAGFDHHHGNRLEIENDILTGRVEEPILDKYAKLHFLETYVENLGITAADCMTIGDGANDIPMLKAAGLGIGYKPKDVVAKELDNIITHGDLSTALYAQGYTGKN